MFVAIPLEHGIGTRGWQRAGCDVGEEGSEIVRAIAKQEVVHRREKESRPALVRWGVEQEGERTRVVGELLTERRVEGRRRRELPFCEAAKAARQLIQLGRQHHRLAIDSS